MDKIPSIGNWHFGDKEQDQQIAVEFVAEYCAVKWSTSWEGGIIPMTGAEGIYAAWCSYGGGVCAHAGLTCSFYILLQGPSFIMAPKAVLLAVLVTITGWAFSLK